MSFFLLHGGLSDILIGRGGKLAHLSVVRSFVPYFHLASDPPHGPGCLKVRNGESTGRGAETVHQWRTQDNAFCTTSVPTSPRPEARSLSEPDSAGVTPRTPSSSYPFGELGLAQPRSANLHSHRLGFRGNGI